MRVVDPVTFVDDSLRVLRAVQLVARFELTVDPATLRRTQATNTWVRGFAYGRGNTDSAVNLLYDASTPLHSSDHDGAVLGDTWGWDGRHWLRYAVGGPLPRTLPAMAGDGESRTERRERTRLAIFYGALALARETDLAAT